MLTIENHRRSFLQPGQPGAFLFYCSLMLYVVLSVTLLKITLENRLLREQLEMSRKDCDFAPLVSTELQQSYPIPFSTSAGMSNAAKPPRQRVPLTTGVLFSPSGPQCLI
ncbi:MAG TPA: hypothetical protein VM553_15825 [Dongiaceae bacterium]|nr:hypothetical protein [Dongiaceae bacterium]